MGLTAREIEGLIKEQLPQHVVLTVDLEGKDLFTYRVSDTRGSYFEIVTDGVEKFETRLDRERLSRLDFEYARPEQGSLIKELVNVGLNYLRGDQVLLRSRGFLKKRQELIVTAGSEEWTFS